MKLSRRELAGLAAGTAMATVAPAQVTGPAAAADPEQAVRDNNGRISEALSKYEIPLATEPAFQFKA
ncbi:MAG: hypothetical protein M3N54_01955 [Acidobacteriota bacterium]|nr:hypothetical protein [Acidobacteriota bacterium]